MLGGHELHSCGSGYGQVTDFYEHRNEHPLHKMREISRSAEELLVLRKDPSPGN